MALLDRPPVWANPHDAHDWVYLAFGKLAAAHIREHPETIPIAREKIVRWTSRGTFTHGMIASGQEWIEIIDKRSPAEIAELLESETEEAKRLRSSMPFVREPFFTQQQSLPILERAYS
jgi:hypothetical protein